MDGEKGSEHVIRWTVRMGGTAIDCHNTREDTLGGGINTLNKGCYALGFYLHNKQTRNYNFNPFDYACCSRIC